VFCLKAVCNCGEERGENMSRTSVESGTPGFVTSHHSNKRRGSREGTWGINLEEALRYH
jgi:hypothetical protein